MDQIVKTKPILFSTEMVQAILEGRKTQTRRTKGLEKVNENPDGHTFSSFSIDNKNANFKRLEGMWQGVDVPYQCGDILWVRETVFDYKNFREFPIFSNIKENYIYKANGHSIGCHKWKPSIHMPKDAARLFLKITNIRVERLFEISEEDAIAEGIECKIVENLKEYRAYLVKDSEHVFGKNSYPDTPQCSFLELWERIYGKESVNSNPWVWVIEFERVEKPENFN